MGHRCEVVIATCDRPGALARCLASLGEQSFADLGVIVVDDASDEPLDDVVALARRHGLDVHLLRLPRRSGPAAARNAGADQATAEFVMFVDDDVCAHRRMVEAHMRNMGPAPDGLPVVSCGPFVEPIDWEPTPWNKWEAVQAKKEADALLAGAYGVTWRQFHTGNNCLPLTLFHAVGGFDETFLRAEDDELALRLSEKGCHFHFEPDAIAWHYAHRPLESWLRIPRAYAVQDVRLDRLHPQAGHLRQRKAELHRRHVALRAARWLPLRTGTTGVAVRAWVGLGRRLHRAGVERAAMAALSAAYDLGYVDALRRAEGADDDELRRIVDG